MTLHRSHNGLDTWVNQSEPSVNYGSGDYLHLQDGERESLLRPHIGAPRESNVVSAILRIRGKGTSGDTYTVTVQRVADPWVEDQVDWNSKPGATGATPSLTATQTVDGQAWDIDVTTLVQTIVNGADYWGFWLTTSDSTERKFYSYDALDFQPVLIVEWSDKPDAPTDLVPSGGSLVSVSKPTVSANFHDPNDDDLAAVQVQVGSTVDFPVLGGPDFDSGLVGTTDPELDLDAAGFAGASNGDTKYWRMRWQNAGGDTSAWSDVARWVRSTKASVTIDNPAASPNDFVEDPTPELAWTVTGGTQVARRVQIFDMDVDGDTPKWDTGRQHTADDTITPPQGVIGPDQVFVLDDEDSTYRLVLRIFDDLGRRTTPGDPAYIEVARTFTFHEDATIDPVTSLTCGPAASDQPHGKLEWDDASFPDGYTIVRRRGGAGRFKVIAHNIDPSDTFVSGTHHAYIDRDAAPDANWTYRVRRRVNGKVGPGPTVDFTYSVLDVWLADQATGRLVPIVVGDGLSQNSFAKPTISTTLRPVNGKGVVHLQQGRYGLEGHIEGALTSHAGKTNDEWLDNLQWMARRPSNTLRLLGIGDVSVRVRIDNVEDLPLEGGQTGDRFVRFDFWSIEGP